MSEGTVSTTVLFGKLHHAGIPSSPKPSTKFVAGPTSGSVLLGSWPCKNLVLRRPVRSMPHTHMRPPLFQRPIRVIDLTKPRLHVTSHHGYLEEDSSDEELLEHGDEADIAGDLCHTGCEVGYNCFPLRCPKSDHFYSQCSSHFLRQLTRPLHPSFPTTLALAMKAEEGRQPKVPPTMDVGNRGRTPLSRVHFLKAF